MDRRDQTTDNLRAITNSCQNKCDSLAPLISLVDSDPGSSCRTDSENIQDDVEIELASVLNSEYSDKTSMSSLNSSSGDFFKAIPHTQPKPHTSIGTPRHNGGTKPSYKSIKLDASGEIFYTLEECVNESPESLSQFSDVTHESFMTHTSPTQSPFIQVMERQSGFDPVRIPASVFSKPLSPMEWSVASNESLFSIHIGNNSFRGHASKRCKDFYRSGEMQKSEEILKSKQICQPEEPNKPADSASDVAKNLGAEIKATDEPVVGVPINKFLVSRTHLGGTSVWEPKNSISATQLQDGRETVPLPVTFPITKKSACPLCYCVNCSHRLCFCMWPSCACKRPCCSSKWSNFSCKWCSWCSDKRFSMWSCSNNNGSCPSCCFKWPTSCCGWYSCQNLCYLSGRWKSCWSCECPSCPSCPSKYVIFPNSCCCNFPSWPSYKYPSRTSCCCNCSS